MGSIRCVIVNGFMGTFGGNDEVGYDFDELSVMAMDLGINAFDMHKSPVAVTYDPMYGDTCTICGVDHDEWMDQRPTA